MGIEIEMEVIAVDHGVGGVAAREDVKHEVVGTVESFVLQHGDVAQQALHLIIMLHIGAHIDVSAERHSQGVVDDTKLAQVGMAEVTAHRSLQGTAIGEGIETEQSLHHGVGAVGIHLDAPSLNVGRKLDVVEVVTVVLHAVDMGDGVDARAWRHHVGACAAGRDGTCEGMERLVEQEMGQGQTVGREPCVVGHALCVNADIAPQRASALRSHKA